MPSLYLIDHMSNLEHMYMPLLGPCVRGLVTMPLTSAEALVDLLVSIGGTLH
jgi:hypothetical protein